MKKHILLVLGILTFVQSKFNSAFFTPTVGGNQVITTHPYFSRKLTLASQNRINLWYTQHIINPLNQINGFNFWPLEAAVPPGAINALVAGFNPAILPVCRATHPNNLHMSLGRGYLLPAVAVAGGAAPVTIRSFMEPANPNPQQAQKDSAQKRIKQAVYQICLGSTQLQVHAYEANLGEHLGLKLRIPPPAVWAGALAPPSITYGLLNNQFQLPVIDPTPPFRSYDAHISLVRCRMRDQDPNLGPGFFGDLGIAIRNYIHARTQGTFMARIGGAYAVGNNPNVVGLGGARVTAGTRSASERARLGGPINAEREHTFDCAPIAGENFIPAGDYNWHP